MVHISCRFKMLARRALIFTRSLAQRVRTFSAAADGEYDTPQRLLREPFESSSTGRLGATFVPTAEEALSRVLESGSKVFLHTAAATPTALVEAMSTVAESKNLTGIEAFHMHIEGNVPHLSKPHLAARIHDRSFFVGANARGAVNSGSADYVPIFLSEVPLLFRRGRQKVDVALITVSPADKHGYHSLGVSVDVARAALQVANKIVALVNPNMPRTFGDASIHGSHIDYAVATNAPLHELNRVREGDVAETEATIGRLVAEHLVRDGATLQLGIGGIPNAVLKSCVNHKDLGIHSEMISDGVVDLIESGVVSNTRKASEVGKTVSSFAIGTRKLYDFLHDNPAVLMLEASYTNDTSVIRKHNRMTGINSCIEIDLTGQIASDSIGTRVFSGVGGQMDFIRGCSLCPDGRAIIALPSTTAKGETRIVPFLKPGAGVVTTRAHAHYVVTEHGVVDLFGRSLRERARALIDIAHPSHKAALEKAAFERGLLKP